MSSYLSDDAVGQTYRRYMSVLAVVGHSWLVVSGIYILTKNTSKGVSIGALTIHLAMSLSYITYGLLRKDRIIVMGSLVSVMSNIFVLICIFIVNSKSW